MIRLSAINQFFLLFLLLSLSIYSQGPDISAGEDITVSCLDPCTDLTATYLEIGNTTSYTVDPISYTPYPFENGINTLIGEDDRWSDIINLGFEFCFFGGAYENVLINSNGALTFSIEGEIDGGIYSPFTLGGWQLDSIVPGNNSSYDARAVLGIFGVLQDTDASGMEATIKFDLLGNYPNRVMVFSWNNLQHYSCNMGIGPQTYQIALYETTNVIEIHVKDRQPCTTWASGAGVIGIQNADATQGYTPPDRNTGDWSAHHEAWRFTPNGNSNMEIIWKDGEGNIVGTGSTINICVEQATTYTAQAVYTLCSGTITTVEDQVTVTPLSESLVELGPDIYTCDNSAIILDANPDNMEGLTFRWFKDDVLVQGATNSTYTVTSENGGYYSVEVSDDSCVALGDVYIEFNSPPTVNYSPSPLIVCDPDSDGYASFDLHDADADITLGNTTLSVNYYSTELDAEINLNLLVNPFTNEVPYNDAVYARVEGPNGCFSIVILDLVIRNSPSLIEPSPIQFCDESLNGLQVFDLSTKEVEMLGEMDPLQYDFYYFENELEALSAGESALVAPDFSNAILNAANYQNTIPFQQTIYVILVGNETNTSPYNGGVGCFDLVPLELLVNPLPIPAEPTPLFVCDEFYNDGFGIFDLNLKNAEISNGDPAVIIRYFETLLEAEAGLYNTEIPSPYQNIVPFLQTIYARAENGATSCHNIVTLDLVVQELPPITQPIDLVVFDEDGDGFAIFDLTVNEAIMLEGLDPSDYYVLYYETEADAATGANPFAFPISFENTQNPQTIYVSVEDINTGCFVIASFEIFAQPLPAPDADNDGIPDADEDLNGNGNLEDDDTDGDGIPNYLDSDDDGDGVETIDEITGIGAGVAPGIYTFIDTDGDGIENYLDNDDDGDGTLTIDEDYNNNGTPLDDDINGNGIPDFLDNEVFLSVNSFDFNDLNIFPNPTSDSFTIQSSQLVSETTVSLYDIQGRIVFSVNKVSQNGTIDIHISYLENGVYFVKISSEGNVAVRKIVKGD